MPFIPICLDLLKRKEPGQYGQETASRSFAGSYGFWFTASCYSLLQLLQRQPEGSGTHYFFPSPQDALVAKIETSSSMVTRKNNEPQSPYQAWEHLRTDFEKENSV